MPNIIPPTRLPSQNPADTCASQSFISDHLSIEKPTTLIKTAITTALEALPSPVIKGSRKALTKQKRVLCIIIPSVKPKKRKPPLIE